MEKMLKVGLIGVGGIARRHFPGWHDSPHAELVALADINQEVLERVGKEQGVGRLYGQVQDLIADPDLDIIDICAPNEFHKSLTIAALDAGKHVICEKPLAPNPADIREMIAARDRSGKMLMTAQHFRYEATSKVLKAEIEKGILGDIYHARSWMLRRSGAPTSPGFVTKSKSGGGPCIDIGVHILDLTLWMMGNPKPVTVTGITHDKLRHLPGSFSDWAGPITPDWDVEEFASAFVRLDNGASLVLEVSWLLHHKTDDEDIHMWLYGDKGGVHWPANEIYRTDNPAKQHYDIRLHSRVQGEPRALECMAFAEAVASGAPSPVPAEQSLDVLTVLDALYRSAAEGREIRIGD
jgi:predicted dehydrogenase